MRRAQPTRRRRALLAVACAALLWRSRLAFSPERLGEIFAKKRLRQALLLALFVAVDTGQAFVTDWAERRGERRKAEQSEAKAEALGRHSGGRRLRYVRQSVLVFEAALAIVVGLVMQWATGAPLQQCFDFQKIMEFAPNCICYSIAISLKMRAVEHYNAGAIKIFGQLRLPMIAFASTLCLARHYDFVQWQAIGIITVSCFAYMHLKEQQHLQSTLACGGLGLLLGWVFLNSFGGILAERAYKSGDLPFFAKFVSEDFGYLLIQSVLLLVMGLYDPEQRCWDLQRRPGGFFDAWDRRTVALVLLLLLDATVGSLLLQEFSALTKCITKAFCVAVVYFVSLSYESQGSSAALTWLAVLVIQSSLLYSSL